MIITRTPMRISFLGGGTDYPDHFRQHGGQTLGVAIDKYSYVTVNRLADLFDYRIRLSYSHLELVKTRDELEHPAVREVLRFLNLDGGIEVNYVGDLPARTGLGTSSSFTVGLLNALHALKGELAGHQQLAEEAVYVEQEMIKERVGVQDQHTCAHGGLVHLRCRTDGSVLVSPLPLSRERLGELHAHLLFLYTGIRRHAHEVLDEQVNRTRQGVLTGDLRHLSGLVDQGVAALAGAEPLSTFGELLHSAWETKKRLSSRVSNGRIDDWYTRAREAGAIGGKLLGAGGGGFLLLFARPERHAGILRALPDLTPVPFQFDQAGSTVLFCQPS